MILLLIIFVITLAAGLPVAFAIGISGAAYFFTNPALPTAIIAQRAIANTQSFTFLAVPFFIFAGNLMNETGITQQLMNLAKVFTRRMTGRTAQVNVVLSTLMGGVSGSATADAAMEARILGKEMVERGYPKEYTAAVTCSTSLITATIPPSMGLVVYGFVGQVSVGRLFAAGIIPGILMCAVLMITVAITSKKHGYEVPEPGTKRATGKEIMAQLKESIWALLFPLILIFGIRFGLFTPSEAGAFAVVYSIAVGALVYKQLDWAAFKRAIVNTVIDNGAIVFIVCMSGIFSYALTYEKLPVILSDFLFGITNNGTVLLFIILAYLLVSGMFLDTNINVLLLTPVFLPILTQLGVDPVAFGIMMMTIVNIGLMTPPVGTAIYTVCGILDCPPEKCLVASWPFFLAIVLEVSVLVFFPEVITFLPDLIFGAS